MRSIRLEFGKALKFVDGAPDVASLPCDVLSTDAGEYMRRYYLEHSADRSMRVHQILQSDPDRALHDHPWDFVSVMLDGSYTEITPDGTAVYTAPCVIVRQAEQLHRLELSAPVWTYVVTGRVRRRWGFRTERGWVPWNAYPGKGTLAACGPSGSRTDGTQSYSGG